jgi:hypothetical protein
VAHRFVERTVGRETGGDDASAELKVGKDSHSVVVPYRYVSKRRNRESKNAQVLSTMLLPALRSRKIETMQTLKLLC